MALTQDQIDEILCLAELGDIPYYLAAFQLGHIDTNSGLASIQYMNMRLQLMARARELAHANRLAN